MDIKKNIESLQSLLPLIIFIFTVGVTYSEFQSMQKDIEVISTRLDKKIKVINDLEDDLNDLEKQVAKLEGCK